MFIREPAEESEVLCKLGFFYARRILLQPGDRLGQTAEHRPPIPDREAHLVEHALQGGPQRGRAFLVERTVEREHGHAFQECFPTRGTPPRGIARGGNHRMESSR